MPPALPFAHAAEPAETSRLGRVVPGLALCALGLGLLLLARTQPAWVGDRIGPGLLAQVLAMGVAGLGALWSVALLLRPAPRAAVGCAEGRGNAAAGPWSGPALLGAVLLFGLTTPVLGLVASASLAAALAAVGAGERRPFGLLVTVAGLGGLVALIGVTLLPPTAPLWPRL